MWSLGAHMHCLAVWIAVSRVMEATQRDPVLVICCVEDEHELGGGIRKGIMERRRARKRESFPKASDQVGIVGAHFLVERVGAAHGRRASTKAGRMGLGGQWPPVAVLFQRILKCLFSKCMTMVQEGLFVSPPESTSRVVGASTRG